MTEQELIDTINALIDADMQGGLVLNAKDIARRAIDRCSEGMFTTEAVTDLVCQIFTIRCEPWKAPPGSRPRLKTWPQGVARIAPKPTAAEILDAGRQAGEPVAATLASIRRAYPGLTEEAMDAEISAYMAWLRDCAEKQSALARELSPRHKP